MRQLGELVAVYGLLGSNPSPGAIFYLGIFGFLQSDFELCAAKF